MTKLLRRLLTGIIWLMILLLLPISVVALYARDEIFDSDQYVSSIGPIAADPDVKTAISNKLVSALDAEAESLSNSDSSIQIALASEYQNNRDEIIGAIDQVLASTQFESVWTRLNRVGHDALVALLRGQDSDIATLDNGEVDISLAPVFDQVRTRLDAQGIDTLDSIELPADQLTLTIFQSDKLADAERWVRLLDKWSIPLAIAVAALAVLFLILAVRKLRALVMLIAVALLGIGQIWVALALGRDYAVERISDPDARTTGLAIYDSVLNPLHDTVRGISSSAIGVGAIALVLMFLRRPTRR